MSASLEWVADLFRLRGGIVLASSIRHMLGTPRFMLRSGRVTVQHTIDCTGCCGRTGVSRVMQTHTCSVFEDAGLANVEDGWAELTFLESAS
jgi:hypothetical protein